MSQLTILSSMSGYKSNEDISSSNDAMDRQRVNIRMLQNILLVWLYDTIDDNSAACHNMATRLRSVVNKINMFTDSDKCIEFIEAIDYNKVFIIISDSFAQRIVPLMHDMVQVHSIFIFCKNKTCYEQWINDWSKIKGIFTEIEPICKVVKQASQQCKRNAISISFMPTSGDAFKKNIDQLDCSFMYTQILKDVLLKTEFEQKHIKQFLDYYGDQFADNDNELNNLKEFEQTYSDKTPIYWYTSECFLYSILNRALRMMDIDIIIKMGFFITDLHRHVKQLHSEQFGKYWFNETFTVYRGQGLSQADFDEMMNTKGGLISFNNFVSTSKDYAVSLAFAESNQTNPDLVGILFVITIDPSISTTPFAFITDVSSFAQEDEVLFSMHTIFRICDIKSTSENNRLFQVDLTLTGDDDKDLRTLTDRIQEETFPDADGWYRLGILLLKMGYSDKAQQIYEVLLGQTSDDFEKAHIYEKLGWIKKNQGEYKEASKFCEKSLEISQKTLPLNHLYLASSYNNNGEMYRHLSEYSKALSSYEKALEIQQQSLSPNHLDLSASYNNIGIVHHHMAEFSKALLYFEKALEIRQQSLPPNHPTLADSYNNIGMEYDNMGEYPKALSSYEKALEIQQQILPPKHPSLPASYNNIGIVYYHVNEFSKALLYYEKALEIYQKSLPSHHPELASSYNNIGTVYDEMGEYSKALSSYEKALEIQQQTLSPNHPNLAASYNNIGLVYQSMCDYSKACSFYELAVDIGQCTFSTDHPHLQTYRKNLENLRNKS